MVSYFLAREAACEHSSDVQTAFALPSYFPINLKHKVKDQAVQNTEQLM